MTACCARVSVSPPLTTWAASDVCRKSRLHSQRVCSRVIGRPCHSPKGSVSVATRVLVHRRCPAGDDSWDARRPRRHACSNATCDGIGAKQKHHRGAVTCGHAWTHTRWHLQLLIRTLRPFLAQHNTDFAERAQHQRLLFFLLQLKRTKIR